MADVAATSGASKTKAPTATNTTTATGAKPVLKGDAARGAVESRTAPAAAPSTTGAKQAEEAAAKRSADEAARKAAEKAAAEAARKAAEKAAAEAAAKRAAEKAAEKAAADAAAKRAAEKAASDAATARATERAANDATVKLAVEQPVAGAAKTATGNVTTFNKDTGKDVTMRTTAGSPATSAYGAELQGALKGFIAKYPTAAALEKAGYDVPPLAHNNVHVKVDGVYEKNGVDLTHVIVNKQGQVYSSQVQSKQKDINGDLPGGYDGATWHYHGATSGNTVWMFHADATKPLSEAFGDSHGHGGASNGAAAQSAVAGASGHGTHAPTKAPVAQSAVGGVSGGGGAAAHGHDASAAGHASVQMALPGTAVGGVSGAGATGHDMAAMGHGTGAHGAEPVLPAKDNRDGSDPRFLAGTVGPVVKEGVALTVKIPDGPGFDGGKGQQQNANDKAQNNYSVTDANFNPGLGLLAKNPDTGKELNYNQHTATYNAAGFLKSTAEYYANKGNTAYLTEYDKIVANQNAGKGTILGAASNIMKLFTSSDPALDGVNVALLQQMGEKIPGSDKSAFEYVRSSTDVTGQAWARMHHPESAWDMFYSLTDLGVDSNTAFKFAGDDGVSGSGRLNGYNNQDGQNSFNAGEVEIWKQAAEYERRTGIPVIQAMMSGHDHTGLDASAKTKPNANKLLGLDPNDVSASAARAAAVRDGLLSGVLSEKNNNGNNGGNNNGGGGGGQADATGHGAGAAAHAHGGGDAGGAGDDGGGGDGGDAGATGHAAGATGHGGGGGGGGDEQVLPALDFRQPAYKSIDQMHSVHIDPKFMQVGDSRFVNGSVGPIVAEGKAKTIEIPDGTGFFGLEGRKQNDGDKAQNNYSVTDANFSPLLGILADKSGTPLNYVQQIQLYSAAGYLEVFAPDVYAQLVAMQDAGGIPVLEAAAYIMGILDAPEAAGVFGAERLASIEAAMKGIGVGKIGEDARIPATIPGTTMDAKTYALSTTDASGQQWARPHHPQSAFAMLRSLLEAGVPAEQAFVLAGDDGVSGSGRLNGYNNQDGKDSFNADEAAVFRVGAEIERATGIPVVQLMMGGHDHTGLDESAKTKPNINKILGLDPNDVSASPARAAALSTALLGNTEGIDIGNVGKFEFDNKRLVAANANALAPMAAPAVGHDMAGMTGMTGMTAVAGAQTATAGASMVAAPATAHSATAHAH